MLAILIIDTNECSSNNGGCEDACINTVGSYLCSCNTSGYYLNANKYNCSGKHWFSSSFITNLNLDINECNINNGGCAQKCINKQGSYHCACDQGYALDTDGHNCSGTIFPSLAITIVMLQILMSVLVITVTVNTFV